MNKLIFAARVNDYLETIPSKFLREQLQIETGEAHSVMAGNILAIAALFTAFKGDVAELEKYPALRDMIAACNDPIARLTPGQHNESPLARLLPDVLDLIRESQDRKRCIQVVFGEFYRVICNNYSGRHFLFCLYLLREIHNLLVGEVDIEGTGKGMKLPGWLLGHQPLVVSENLHVDLGKVNLRSLPKGAVGQLGTFEAIAVIMHACMNNEKAEDPWKELTIALDQYFSLKLGSALASMELARSGATGGEEPLATPPVKEEAIVGDSTGTTATVESPPNPTAMPGDCAWLTEPFNLNAAVPFRQGIGAEREALESMVSEVVRNAFRRLTKSGTLPPTAINPNSFIKLVCVGLFGSYTADGMPAVGGPGPVAPASTDEQERLLQVSNALKQEGVIPRDTPPPPAESKAVAPLLSLEEQRRLEAEKTGSSVKKEDGGPVAALNGPTDIKSTSAKSEAIVLREFHFTKALRLVDFHGHAIMGGDLEVALINPDGHAMTIAEGTLVRPDSKLLVSIKRIPSMKPNKRAELDKRLMGATLVL